MIVGIEECETCGQPVIRAIRCGRDLLVETVPHPEGDLELLGIRTLRKPIAAHVDVRSPALLEPKLYRPHTPNCAPPAPASSEP